MVALYSPCFTPSIELGFGFEDDPTNLVFGDSNPSYDHVPKKSHEASSLASDVDPYSCWGWDVDEMIISPILNTDEEAVAGDKNKKQSHNASERMRRMKINALYASLRSLLPNSQHMKKLSIPNTVDRVVKYIPDLQKEVEVLLLRKDQLLPALASAPTTTKIMNFSESPLASNSNNKSSSCSCSCSCSVQATPLGNGQISVQISTPKSFITTFVPVSEVLRELEEEDYFVFIDVSSSESDAGRVFHHFHLMALEASQEVIKCELLRQKILSQCHKWEQLCLWMISQGLVSSTSSSLSLN